MATATPKTNQRTVERTKSSRKRSIRESSDAKQEHEKVNEQKEVPTDQKKQRRKKQKKINDSGTSESKTTTKKPLAGMTISVSTLSDNTKSKIEEGQTTSYNEVCQTCRELGATVIDLVCKRVNLLVCTEDAVKQATQRVRKAIKKNKPLLSVAWLNRCKDEGRRVEYEEYRLDTMAREYIQNREARLQSEQDRLDDENIDVEAVPDAGWSEPQDLGCCCVCHENDTAADCPWCKDAPCNPNRVSEK